MEYLITEKFKIASQKYKSNPVCKNGLTPFVLIINEIVTYQNWLDLIKSDPNDIEAYFDRESSVAKTEFAKKLLNFAEGMGYCGFCFSWKFKRRTDKCELESIKLLNVRVSLIFSEEI